MTDDRMTLDSLTDAANEARAETHAPEALPQVPGRDNLLQEMGPSPLAEASPETEGAFKSFMADAQKRVHDKLGYTKGKKYWRIYREVGDDSKSAYGFFDPATGDLLKADGWKRPAKKARGNVMDKSTWHRAGKHSIT
jgi:hypothetical protein